MRLQGKVAMITGGAHGMGEAEANMFAKEGAKVVVADVLEEEGQQVVAGINKVGGEAIFVRLDVTNEQEWQRAVGTAVARFGKLDILVNNAGISGSADADLLTGVAYAL
jgi:NAD(P)-dependent dehydrogenase (short-subunit alcohol dehydrogenase family)